jgi:hypothetical protein
VTEIYVAKRTGILREPNGVQHRVYAGKTLASAGHPAVIGSPDSWRPMTVDLPFGDVEREQADPGHPEDAVAEELAEVEAERDGLLKTLTALVEGLDERGLLPTVGRDREGWLVAAVLDKVDELSAAGAKTIADVEQAEPIVVPAPELADPATPEGREAIREWAWAHDIDVAERGTIPKAVVEQYRAAHA